MGSHSTGYIRSRRKLAAFIVCAALLPGAVRAENWKFSSSVNYETGKYGTSDRVNSWYVPFTLKHYYTNSDLSVTAPYVSQSSTGRVTWVGGKPVRVNGKVVPANTGTSSGSGLGDILVHGTYALKKEKNDSFSLALGGKLKLPTADKNKGLGTGEMDEAAGLEFSKDISTRWTLLADGYYTIIGDPAGVDYNNQIAVDIGFYRVLGRDLALTVLFETESAIVDGNADPRSISATLSRSVREGLQIFGGLTLGMSDGSPDAGVSAGFSGRF